MLMDVGFVVSDPASGYPPGCELVVSGKRHWLQLLLTIFAVVFHVAFDGPVAVVF